MEICYTGKESPFSFSFCFFDKVHPEHRLTNHACMNLAGGLCYEGMPANEQSYLRLTRGYTLFSRADEAGFMGIEGNNLEMLFIAPEKREKGLGKALLQYGIENYAVRQLSVNEQNPQAKGFYEHMGFRVYKKTELDEQGRHYPLLYLGI